MTESNFRPAFLVLSDGTFFEGFSFGADGTVVGEVVFNTGMTGYQEVLTDPSYFGQLVTFTYPEIGNTGVNNDDQEAISPYARGVVVRQCSLKPSNWRSQKSLQEWLKTHNVVGISGVDTRLLVRHLRECGSMNGLITTELDSSPVQLLDRIKKVPLMEGLNLADEVSVKSPYSWTSTSSVVFDKRIIKENPIPYRVVAIDFGIKRSILERLVSHGCEVEVLPSNSDFEEVLSLNPEGVFLSNGPGDPAAVTRGISLARYLIENTKLPLFGICLGHQILGIALGGKTFKLTYGHRGLNHPCGTKGKVEITSQNHGFALDPSTIGISDLVVTHQNLNDRTVAGFELRDRPVFGVQYHPESSPGPHDADHHFSRFVSLMEERR